ncbi:Laminin subunit beta-4 [Dissostichus eleginoides]|uniref:Laminin subunit beta-4 n=1 Tax=Dissostichus eleginoides TaxID=100907 RepID=A0AAD9B8W3_DISEL|nr:Laminin subunit beta-4 [Dissostichus eleginoides]
MIESESKEAEAEKLLAQEEVFLPKPPVKLEGKEDKKSVRKTVTMEVSSRRNVYKERKILQAQEERKLLLKTAGDKMNDQKHNRLDSGQIKKLLDQDNDVIIQAKERKQKVSEMKDRKYEELIKAEREEAKKKDEEIIRKKKSENREAADSWINEIREREQLRIIQKLEKKKGAESILKVDVQFKEEQKKDALEQAAANMRNSQNHLEEMARIQSNRERKAEASRTVDEIVNRDRKEIDLRNLRRREQEILSRNTVGKIVEPLKKAQALREDRPPKEMETKLKRLQLEERGEKAATMKSINEDRQRQMQEREQKKEAERQRDFNWFQSGFESDKLALALEELKAKKSREDRIAVDKCNEMIGERKRARLIEQQREASRWGTMPR